jgi:hypothetical protein
VGAEGEERLFVCVGWGLSGDRARGDGAGGYLGALRLNVFVCWGLCGEGEGNGVGAISRSVAVAGFYLDQRSTRCRRHTVS